MKTRKLKVQFRVEKEVFSLPEITITNVELTAATLAELLKESATADVVLNLINNQCHIAFSSRMANEWLASRKITSPAVAETAILEYGGYSYVEAIKAQAKRLAERKSKTNKEDPIVTLIKTKWDASDKKVAFLQRLGLSEDLLDKSAVEVESAYIKQKSELNDLL